MSNLASHCQQNTLMRTLSILKRVCQLGQTNRQHQTIQRPVVVAINQFETDTDAEIKLIQSLALKAGADFAVPSNHWAKGGAGAVELASSVVKAVKLAPLEQQSTSMM